MNPLSQVWLGHRLDLAAVSGLCQTVRESSDWARPLVSGVDQFRARFVGSGGLGRAAAHGVISEEK
ncbi:MAG: hypothetical protein LBV06_04925 [Propionibacteriaceae bacterium]|jgi:hypothetical protein|nr:hypothetical protein [Propionibacteriaceae bacterium]